MVWTVFVVVAVFVEAGVAGEAAATVVLTAAASVAFASPLSDHHPKNSASNETLV